MTLPAGSERTATGVSVPVPAERSPLTASKLVSRPDFKFMLAQGAWQSYRLTFLMHQPAGKAASPVAVMSTFQAGNRAHVWVQQLGPSKGEGDRGEMEIATLEHLYGLILGQDPEAGFCLTGFGQKCGGVDDEYAHPELLRALHDARQRATAGAKRAASYVPWHVVSMTPVPDSGIEDQVGARVASEGGPIAGATVFFNRAPHSSCSAKTSPDGFATCRLVDQHGDEDAHADEDKVPVLATFPGNVQPERVLLPTTRVMKPKS